jgi:hypothetical protein
MVHCDVNSSVKSLIGDGYVYGYGELIVFDLVGKPTKLI